MLRALRPFGVWFGRRTIYLPRLLRPDAAALLALLWGVWTRQAQLTGTAGARPDLFRPCGRAAGDSCMPPGFAVIAGRAIRFDMLERLEDELDKAAVSGAEPPHLLPKLVSLLGAGNDEARAVLAALGWRLRSMWRMRRRSGARPRRTQTPAAESHAQKLALAGLKTDRQMSAPRPGM